MRSCFTNRLLLAVESVLPASQPFEMIIPFVSLSALCRHGGLIIVILLFYLLPVVCVCVCMSAALLWERRSQYDGGWTAWFLQQESSTRQVTHNQFYFCAVVKNCRRHVIITAAPEDDTHTRVKTQTLKRQHSKSRSVISNRSISKQTCKNFIL